MSETRWLSDEEQRMWRRYRDVNQLLDLAIERQLQRDAAMSQSDYSVLVSLSEAEGGGLRARDLGAALGWDRSRVSHQVRRMEGRGLVSKNECTEDGRFSIEACRCIGACGLAPVFTVNDDVYGRLEPDDVESILDKYR